LILWLAAPAMLLLALGIGWTVISRKPQEAESLTADEQAELDKILKS